MFLFILAADYPVPANFLAPLPAWPVNVSECTLVSYRSSLVSALLINVYIYCSNLSPCMHTAKKTCQHLSKPFDSDEEASAIIDLCGVNLCGVSVPKSKFMCNVQIIAHL